MHFIKHSIYLVTFVCLLLLPACGDDGYLLQSIKGHLDVMSRTRPIDKILAQEGEPENVRKQLTTVVKLRDFAIHSLSLPDNGSYKEYADLQRPYAVWNMVVAPELSLDLNQWCFPVVGCVTYRGYFDEMSAQAAAGRLKKVGFDVDVYGVQAYSTLNWFDDPVLNTFLVQDEIRLASLLFHEMAHQVVYVPNDTSFNESFAKAVELEGLKRWSNSEADPAIWDEFQRREKRSGEFQKLLANIRNELNVVYKSPFHNDAKRLKKKDILEKAYADYEILKEAWGGYNGYDSWVYSGLNNARLASVAPYYDYVPSFQELLRSVDFDLQEFYLQVKSLAKMPKDERNSRMSSLMPVINASLQVSELRSSLNPR